MDLIKRKKLVQADTEKLEDPKKNKKNITIIYSMEVETITKENCKFFTKKELIDEIKSRIDENNDEIKEILEDAQCKTLDELLAKNALEQKFDDEVCEICETEQDTEFYESIIHYLEPKPK